MSIYQVTCITPDGRDTDRRIDRLGGPQFNKSIDEVIWSIRYGGDDYWTSVNGKFTWVKIKQHPISARDYLATEPDNYPQNNLLSLPTCP